MERKARIVPTCVAAAIGVVAGYLMARPHTAIAPPPSPHEAPRPSPSAADGSAEAGAVERGASPTDPVAPAAREAGQGPIPAQLRDYAIRELHRGWGDVRDDAMPPEQVGAAMLQFEAAVLAMPHALGQQFARAQDERDAVAKALAVGDGVALLQNLASGDPEADALLRDGARFATLFAPRANGAVVGASQLRRIDDQLSDGAVLSFGAGVFAVSDLMKNKDPFPVDVTLRGAGMDATLLVLNELSTNGPLRRFRIEDCTVYTNDYLTHLRDEPAVMSFRSVRFVGFDMGAGGSLCFSVDRAAIHASQCRFEGGYGRNPGSGNLLRVGGPSLCRFESCSFSRIRIDDFDALTAVFVDCVMTEMLTRSPPVRGVELDGCRFESWSGANDNPLRRDLNDLFPQWQERMQR